MAQRLPELDTPRTHAHRYSQGTASGRMAGARSLAAWVRDDGPLSRAYAVGWVVRLCKTLEPLHRAGKPHGGISADTILATSRSPSGVAALASVETLRPPFGFYCPERLVQDRPSTVQDVWAAGVLLHLLLTGALPFPGRNRREVRAAISAGPAATLVSFDAGDATLQGILDRVLAPLPDRIVRIGALREALERWRPELRLSELAPLGPRTSDRPDGLWDDPTDDDEEDDEPDTYELELATARFVGPRMFPRLATMLPPRRAAAAAPRARAEDPVEPDTLEEDSVDLGDDEDDAIPDDERITIPPSEPAPPARGLSPDSDLPPSDAATVPDRSAVRAIELIERLEKVLAAPPPEEQPASNPPRRGRQLVLGAVMVVGVELVAALIWYLSNN